MILSILIGALFGGIFFFVVPGMLPGTGNLAGLVGLMIFPIGVIAGAVAGAAYWSEHSAKAEKRLEKNDQVSQ